MVLEDRIMADFKEAMKARDQMRTQTLSFLRSELKYCGIDKKKEKLDDVDVIGVVKKLIKQRQDSIQQFEKGNRQDLADKEKKELAILKSYLPQELSQGEVSKVVVDCLAALGSVTIKDMGRVIKEVMAKTQGQADGKMVSDIVRAKLEVK